MYKSHLLQMRGLKLRKIIPILWNEVASFTDAWIETEKRKVEIYPNGSHLLQMRGLKHGNTYHIWAGLHVASFTDAWIETTKASVKMPPCAGRIFYRCVD